MSDQADSILDLLSEADERIEESRATNEMSTLEVLDRLESLLEGLHSLGEGAKQDGHAALGPHLAALGQAIGEAFVILQSNDIVNQQLGYARVLIQHCCQTLESHNPIGTSRPSSQDAWDPDATVTDRDHRQSVADSIFAE